MLSQLGTQALFDRPAARRRILQALTRAKGDRTKAAAELDLSHRHFYRLLAKLDMWADVDRLAREQGWERPPGPPRGSRAL